MPEKEYVIYGLFCLCHPGSGIQYVGQSWKVKSRFRDHLWASGQEGQRKKRPVLRWINAHGTENIGYSILEICSESDIDAREIAWIEDLRNNGLAAKNISSGGSGRRGFVMSESQRKLMSDQRKGIPKSKETRERMSQAQRRRGPRGPKSDEAKLRDSLAKRGQGSYQAILTESQVWDILMELYTVPSYFGQITNIAKKYGVARINISQIKHGRNWRHVKNEFDKRFPPN